MDTAAFSLRRATDDDFDRFVDLYEEVAGEGKWIGGELPVDRGRLHERFGPLLAGRDAAVFLAEADGQLIGHLTVHLQHGVAELGMLVAGDWRGKGVGSAFMRAGMEWAGQAGAHKVALQVWPHNVGARRLYERFGFVEEGRLRRHWRRHDGSLWDSIVMGRMLDSTAPGSPFAE
jgi:RimJ/RimL family protein N-acetyltransferase